MGGTGLVPSHRCNLRGVCWTADRAQAKDSVFRTSISDDVDRLIRSICKALLTCDMIGTIAHLTTPET
ncbi:hypothetical protein QEP66_20675 [Streptomyces sp. LB8]|uniref:Uncharacterized protein n=1 Tax=Streptomyces thermogriseus TaxID=75292 RepID=A0ABN1T1C4_9ACTN|nr:hypothetical protein [Streptomyces sp. LB8]MDN5384456.1 hypothetical protein [Streptomyces sp. LB8]